MNKIALRFNIFTFSPPNCGCPYWRIGVSKNQTPLPQSRQRRLGACWRCIGALLPLCSTPVVHRERLRELILHDLTKHRHFQCSLSTDNKVAAVLCTMMFYPLGRKQKNFLWAHEESPSFLDLNLIFPCWKTPDTTPYTSGAFCLMSV